MSLNGYIADSNGDINWLKGEAPEKFDLDSYEKFIKGIDTVIIGWKTYHQIITELSPKRWSYEGLITYVITHKEEASKRSDIKFKK